MTSSDTTFDAVQDQTAAQFPARIPSTTDLSAKVDRLDSRISAGAAAAGDASDAASRALIAGITLGGIGVVLGAAGIVLALRARRVA